MRVQAGTAIFDIDGIVFDKDGTLISLDSYWLEASRQWIETAAEPEHRRALAARLGLADAGLVADGPFATASLDDLVRLTIDTLIELGADNPHGRAMRGRARATEIAAAAAPQPIGDVAGAIRRLAVAGLRLAVVTTDDRSAALSALATLGIAQHFNVVLGADECVPVKPDPAVLGVVAHQLGTIPERLLMVGDSERDRATARNGGGAGFVLVADQPRIPADAVIRSVDELVPKPAEPDL